MPSARISRLLRGLGYAGAAGVAADAGTLAYAAGYEVRGFVVRRVGVAVLPPGHEPLRVLHLSDLHLTPTQGVKQRWLASLAGLGPDLVVNTGDNIAHPEAVPPLLDSLGGLLDVPGVFVLGSNDYFSPKLRNPMWYLLPDDGRRNVSTPELPWGEMVAAFEARGWSNLGNTSDRFSVGGTDLAFVGVDDPHLEYDDLAAVRGPVPGDADLRVAVTHAPYLRVLDQFVVDGYDLVLAGHTHGGQVRLPGKGALVTNCDLDTGRARGLHRHPAASNPGDPGSAWLHVSAGAGTSPYAPIRFCCRPEATLLTLLPRER